MPADTPQPQEKKGFFARMGLLQKIMLFIAVLIVLILTVGILLGGIKDFYQFFFYLIVLSIVIIGVYLIIKTVGMVFQPKYYSPREDFKTKIENMAVDYKPDNVNDLYFMATDWKKRIHAGKIIGLLNLPYYTGEVQRYVADVLAKDGDEVLHRKGDVIYTELKDLEGRQIPRYQDVKLTDDGDTLFLVKKGWFIFAKTHLIRANRAFHGVLHGDVDIFDINPVPYGMFEYPFKQLQKNVSQIMVQNQIETILMTHEHQHDLISQGVDSAIWFNPHMRFIMKQQAEATSDEQA